MNIIKNSNKNNLVVTKYNIMLFVDINIKFKENILYMYKYYCSVIMIILQI